MTAAIDKTLYDVLEISPRATKPVIEAAYKTLIKKYHPDKNKGDERIAKTLNEAKTILLNDNKRKGYDKERQTFEGKIINNYQILERITEGRYGDIYKGEHLILKSPVCIKHCKNISPQDTDLFFSEAKVMWNLRHYGVPIVRDFFKFEDGTPGIVMSYINGPTLEKIVEKNKQLDPEHVMWIAERTANILKYLHYNGVIHGDVKPANIIIQPENHMLVLVDYGFASIIPRELEDVKGATLYYSAPEQRSGNIILPESDFYSLGMTMVYSLGGNVKTRTLPEKIPEPICDLIEWLTERDVDNRPHWDYEDLCEEIIDVRKQVFGRTRSKMKPIPGFEMEG
ncbi:MAG: protein kinase [Nanoarchaeota archaeon]|nr:protein kinase [Nanoarchaeota archaeon]MBU1030916.1 protein kinase [Nanoarchaeota archaeon]MBU1850691.1 protein kinase [Nanoarchaeota archaeon]